jgi:hypothetical protein
MCRKRHMADAKNPYLTTSVICAVCRKEKTPDVDWVIVIRGIEVDGAPARLPFSIYGQVPLYYVLLYAEDIVRSLSAALPICGEECLHKLRLVLPEKPNVTVE